MNPEITKFYNDRAEVKALWDTMSNDQKAIVREELSCRFITDFSRLPLNKAVKKAFIEECSKV